MQQNIRILVSILIAGLFVNSSQAQSRSDLMSKDLIIKNKIESVSQLNHKIVKGKVDPNGYISVITTYDNRGNIILVENLKSDGSKSSTHEYVYDKDDNKLSYIQHQMVGKKLTLSFKQLFTYENGKKIVEDGFDGMSSYKIKHTYFPDGKQNTITKANAFGRVEEKWVYEHNGNETKINVYRPETKLDKVIIKKFDSLGNLIEETTLKDGQTELSKNIFTYNKNGKISNKEEYYARNLKAKYEYKYNADNLVEIYQTPSSGSTMLYSAYKYDSNGNMIEERWYDGQPDDYSNRKIQLDNNGNVNQVETYYSDYKYKVVYRYKYKFR